MEFLEFVRGPGLQVAMTVFVIGVIWRLAALLLRPQPRDLSVGRGGRLWGALVTIVRRSWSSASFREKTSVPYTIAWAFHLGLFVIVVGGTPHILFFGDLMGLTWPGLPKGVIDIVAGVTLGALIFALWRRVTHPVRRMLSGVDDYVSWALTTATVLTGLLATSGLGARYETLLAVHILSFELLLVWFPWGKLMHAFLFVGARGATGARFAHRGAPT